MSDKTILFSGLPNSGKTTFIAALWYYLFYSTGKAEYSFDTLENSEQEYLNAISLKWASCEDVIRTNPTKLEDISIRIRNNSSGEKMMLNVPDINGERFNTQFEFRQWEEDFESLIKNSHGLILFVDPRDAKNKPRLIYQENQYYRMFGDEKPKNVAPAVEWTEKLAPSQVKLVDFLQMLDYHKPGTIERIAILISCWDVVKNETDPKNWAKTHVPLLYQYLTANKGLFESKFYGISSQGGNYENDRAKLQQMEPLERILVTDGEITSKNILSPILWLTDEH
jgi:GTPase SAR1 family protein